MVILPSGQYGTWEQAERQQLQDWVRSGGKLIAIDGALELLADQEGFGLSVYESEEEKAAQEKADKEKAKIESLAPYQDRERLQISNFAPGAVFEVKMDDTYALGFGTAGTYYTLRNHGNHYAYLSTGINAGIIPTKDHHRSGFIGYQVKNKMDKALVFGVEEMGNGQVVYMVDNPLFRSFWESGKLIMANAVFLVGQ